MTATDAPLLCVMGPTAAGKTDLAIQLAEALGGELISVDSALVYRGLDIGSAKPDYPHHLIDIRDPAQPYSAADFVADAREAIVAVRARGHTPILVGGTMLYYRALLLGLDEMPAADPIVREAIEQAARERGWPALHAELAAVDPESAATIHPNHSQRIGRALEVWRQSGVPMSRWQRGAAQRSPAPHLALAVCPIDRRVLHDRIALRLDQMLAQGFVEEVAGLRDQPALHPDLPAMRAVGYRQIWGHLAGEYDLDTARLRAQAATRQLAKRQLTWLRSWRGLHWLQTDTIGQLVSVQVDGETTPSSNSLLETAQALWQHYLRTQNL